MVTQILVAIAETYFFGRLGTEALAGFALVYPLMMLMQMMASGGMGGGGTGLDGIFVAIAAGIVLYAATLALPLLVKPWGPNVLGLHP